jgi:hypothetical protein
MKDLAADVKRLTYGSLGDQVNLVSQPYTAGATSLVLDMDVSNITPGMMLSSGLNVWYVKGADVPNKTVFVIPGYDNAPTASADVNDFVYIKPRVTEWYLFNVLNDEIARLSSPEAGLYKIDSFTDEVDPTYQTYDIPSGAANMIGLLRIRYRMPGTTDVWIDIPNKSYRLQINDGVGRIRLLRNIPSGTEIEFLYKAPFTRATSLSDDVETVCGLTSTMTDIPPLGACARLLRTTEGRRNQVQQQGDARRAGEVVSGSNTETGRIIGRDYTMRVQEEYARLMSRVSYVRSL